MAFTVTENDFVRLGGSMPALCLLKVTAVNTAGDSGGVIQPGNQLVGTDIAEARALRKIIFAIGISETDENPVEASVAYDTTHDGDVVTLDCTANETISVFIIGYDSGA